MANSLSIVEKHPGIWRGNQTRFTQTKRIASGYACLDDALLGGLPEAGVVRIACHVGSGELAFLNRVFTCLSGTDLFVFINPKGRILAPWLESMALSPEHVTSVYTSAELSFWAAEEAIKSDACRVVLLWSKSVTAKQSRRLQVAATQHACLVFIFETPHVNRAPLPIPLDLTLSMKESALHIDINKLQGGWPKQGLVVPFSYTPDNTAIAAAMSQYGSQHNESDALHG